MSLSGLVSEESRLQGLRPENGRDRVRETQSCHHPSASRARSAGGLLRTALPTDLWRTKVAAYSTAA